MATERELKVRAGALPSGAVVANRAQKRQAEKKKIPFCQKCRRVYKVTVGAGCVVLQCKCGAKALETKAKPAANEVLAQAARAPALPAAVIRAGWWRRALAWCMWAVAMLSRPARQWRRGLKAKPYKDPRPGYTKL